MTAAYDPGLLLYFQHIPKTAGTSVATMLAPAFPPEQVCPVLHWDSLVRLSPQRIARYRLFTGHYSSYLPRYLDQPCNTFTFVRDPVARSFSHYGHVLRDTSHPFHAAAKAMSLREFVLDPETRPNIENYQARYIADLGLDPRKIAAQYAGIDAAGYPLQMRIDELSLAAPADELLDAALKGLDRFFFIGLVDDFVAGMERVGAIIGKDLGPTVATNTAPQPSTAVDLPAETLAAIYEATEVDRRLYETIKARVRASAALGFTT